VENQMIDVTITACNRPDLLLTTVRSFLQFADLPIGNIYVFEDSCLPGINDEVKKEFPQLIFIEPETKAGQLKALDVLISNVKTEYWMALEEDWTFDKTGFMSKSLDILQNNAHISEVWLRYPKERNGHPCHGIAQKTLSGTKYHIMKTGYRGVWHGTSFGPSLRRLSDYQKLFPNGMYSEIHWSPSNPLQAEQLVGKKYFKNGYRASTLLEGFCLHSGINRHVKG
jgi:hypothetical protein